MLPNSTASSGVKQQSAVMAEPTMPVANSVRLFIPSYPA
ncbi:hypothetical protein Rifp1Sym_bf00160 [endosymbiont of Riftia pachyptila (vent Ph05)]|uniref:Uncharacterized protein n=1 Tax=endosymbiont of Riftia pachyptila (vent Ph05) TaxID=1048808 RepID=G2DCV7_9GAMM|nr:hypothetical protein Rifp1Sym_bf00160 [endosymbiont of Riftia pachyptila (vent Ph05)]